MTETPTVLAGADGVRRLPSAMPTPTLDIVVPVYNEEADLAPSVRRLHRVSHRIGAVLGADHHRRQRQHRRDAAGRADPRGRTRRRRGAAPRREGSRPRTAHRLAGLGRDRRRLHGRRPVHGSRGPAPARRAAGVRSLRHRHRHPPLAWLTGGPRHQEGVHLPWLQPAAANVAARRLLRRPVRVQGDARRRRARTAAARRGRRMVLRHRVAGHRRTRGPAHPRGAGRLGRRPGQPRRHRRHRPQGSARHLAPGSGVGQRLAADRSPAELARARTPRRGGAARHDRSVAPFRHRRHRQHRRLRRPLRHLPRRDRRAGREFRGPAAHRDLQHRRQPRVHLRRAWLGRTSRGTSSRV